MEETYVKKLVKYIKKNLKKGYTLPSLKWSLISQGYSRTAVKKAIKKANHDLAKSAPKLKDKPKIRVEKEPILQEIDEPSWKDKSRNFFARIRDIIRS